MVGHGMVVGARRRVGVVAVVCVAAVLAAAGAGALAADDPLPRVEEDHAAVAFSSRWRPVVHANRSGGAGMLSRHGGDSVEVVFTGPEVRWVTSAHTDRGIAQVHIDGVDHGTVDTYRAATEFQAVVFTATGLGEGPHTLRITNTGQANPAATDVRVEVDAIEAAGVVALDRFEQDDAAVAFSSRWQPVSHAHRSQDTGMLSRHGGDSVEVVFTGPSVRWITTTHPSRGIAQVHIDGVDHGTVDTYSAATVFQAGVFTATGLGEGPHTLRITTTGQANPAATDTRVEVDAIDAAGVVAVQPRFEQDDAAVAFSSRWQPVSHAHRSQDTAMLSRDGGDSVEVVFTGPSVRWITTTHPSRGIARVHIDGVDHGTVDTYSADTVFQAGVFTATGLGEGPHTLRITNTGQANPAATDIRVEVDAIDAAGVVALDRVEQDHAALAFTPHWQSVSHSHRSQDTAMLSRHGGDSVEVVFTGPTVRWITTTHPNRGIAQVHIDDVDHGTVDTYSAATVRQTGVFTATGLGDGPHTLRITTTGQANPAATDTRVEVDAIDAAGVVVIDRAPVAVDDDLAAHAPADITTDVGSNHGHGSDYLGVPAATLASFGGGDLGGDVTSNPAGASVALAGGTLTVGADGALALTGATTGGIFTFDYRLASTAGADDATVTITITQDPQAADDHPDAASAPGDMWHTALDTVLDTAGHPAPSVLANDSLGHPAATLTSFGGGTLGGDVTTNAAGATATVDGHTLTAGADGHLVYTPKTGFTGELTFDYRLTNPLGTTDATVTIAVGQRPAAVADTYPDTLVGNIGVDTATATPFTVTGNDTGDALTLTAGAATNGEVTLNPDGTFVLDPAAGFTDGDATFTYTVTNGFGTSPPVTVTVPVGGQAVWFIDNTAPACTTLADGCGRLSAPLSDVTAFNALNTGVGTNPGDGHHIFLAESPTAYTGPLVLLDSQRLLGQDATAPLAALTGVTPPTHSPPLPLTGVTPPAHSPGLPLMNPAGPATTITGGVTLAADNRVHGLTLGDAATALTGGAVGALTVDDVTITTNGAALDLANGTIDAAFDAVTSTSGNANITLVGIDGTADLGGGALSGAASDAVRIDGGTATVTYTGSITATTGRSVRITGKTGGTTTLAGEVTDTGGGITLAGNTGATTTFTGGLSLSTGTTPAFTATGGGTVTAIQDNTTIVNTLTTTTATALLVENTTIGADGLTFRAITAGTGAAGPANGILLTNTGTQGGLTVTGTGTPGSGGTIQRTTGDDGAIAGNGVYLSGTRAVDLSWMQLNDHTNNGIFGTGVDGLRLDHVVLSGANGTSNSGLYNEAAVRLADVSGDIHVTDSTLNGGAMEGFRLHNQAAGLAVDLLLERNTVSHIQGSVENVRGSALWAVVSNGTADMVIRDNTLTYWWGNAVTAHIVSAASGTMKITGNTVHQTSGALAGAGGIGIVGGHLDYEISDNTVAFTNGAAIAASRHQDGAQMRGRIHDNTIGIAGVANSGSAVGSGIYADHHGSNTTTVRVSDNTIRQINGSAGLLLLSGDSLVAGTPRFNATAVGNDIRESGTSSLAARMGILVTHGTSSSPINDTDVGCYDIGGTTPALRNTVVDFNTDQASTAAHNRVRVNQRFATTSHWPGYTGAATGLQSSTDLAAYLLARNTISNVINANSSTVGFHDTVPAGSGCPQPPVLP